MLVTEAELVLPSFSFLLEHTYQGQAAGSSDGGCSRHKLGRELMLCSTLDASSVTGTWGCLATGTTDNTGHVAPPSCDLIATPPWEGAHIQWSPLPCSPKPGGAFPAETPWAVWAWTGPLTSLPDLPHSPFHTNCGFHAALPGASTNASRGKSV